MQNLIFFSKIFENYFSFQKLHNKKPLSKALQNALIAAYLFLRQNEKCKLKPELHATIEAYTFWQYYYNIFTLTCHRLISAKFLPFFVTWVKISLSFYLKC